METIKLEHDKISYGKCPTCKHYGDDCTGTVSSYRILRFFSNGRPPKRVKVVSSLKLAQLHCNDPLTKGVLRSGVRWFEGWRKI